MPRTVRHIALGLVVVAAGAAAGLAAGHGLKWVGWWGAGDAPVTLPMPLPAAVTSPAGTSGAARRDRNPVREAERAGRPVPLPVRTVPTAETPWSAAAPALHTSLLIDGATHPVSGDHPVALPSGTRFRLRVASGEAAAIEVHAVNPAGRATGEPLWQGVVAAGQPATTPPLRLAGLRGMETLRVMRRTLDDGLLTEQQVQVLHH